MVRERKVLVGRITLHEAYERVREGTDSVGSDHGRDPLSKA